MSQDDTRGVDLFTSEHVPHKILIQIVQELMLVESRNDIADDDLVEQLVWEVEMVERQWLVGVGRLHPLADTEVRERPRFLLKVAKTFAGGEVQD